jgi:hypothetical protein
MTRCLPGAAAALVLALAGCGVAHGAASSPPPGGGGPGVGARPPAVSTPSQPPAASGQQPPRGQAPGGGPLPARGRLRRELPPPRFLLLPRRWLPVISPRLVAAEHLVPLPWRLQRLEPGGTVADISFLSGGCRSWPAGVVIRQSPSAVTMALEAHGAQPGLLCPSDLVLGLGRVRIPALHGRPLRPVAAPVAATG